MSGTINGQPVVVFKNTYKKAGSNAPDYRVLKAKPRNEAPVRDEFDDAF